MAATERVKTVRGITVYKKTDTQLKKLLKSSRQPEIHGNKVWFSSFLIMDYLEVVPPPRRARVMEIGCGWGLLSIYCADKFKADVVAVDADPNVFPFLRLHAERNGVAVRTLCKRYQSIPPRRLAGLDLLAGGDICFWDELVNPLFRLIQRAVEQKVGTIVIADPGRPPFLKLARRCRNRFGAHLLPYSITDPKEEEGYLLTIYN